jgi:hypothetical protein
LIEREGLLGKVRELAPPQYRAMNPLAEVGRVTPSTLRSSAGLVSALGISATEDGCAPCLALQEIVVAAVGAQRTARPTFRFMERPLFLTDLLTDHESSQ